MKIKQYDIWLADLNPTIGSEINKTRPCVIISPDEMNCLNTLIISPLLTIIENPLEITFTRIGLLL